MNSDDDLVVLVEAFSLCTVLSRDTPERLASERCILIEQLDERIERCQHLLYDANASLRRKFEGAEREFSESRTVYQRAITDFRRHVDARSARAEKQLEGVTEEIRSVRERISSTADQLDQHLEAVTVGWFTKVKYGAVFFCVGFLCAIFLRRA